MNIPLQQMVATATESESDRIRTLLKPVFENSQPSTKLNIVVVCRTGRRSLVATTKIDALLRMITAHDGEQLLLRAAAQCFWFNQGNSLL